MCKGKGRFTYANSHHYWAVTVLTVALVVHYPCQANVARGYALPSAPSLAIDTPMIRPLIALLALVALVRADEWENLRNCRLMDNASNDGDSFHVKADGEERIFRLYFVDTPEAEDGGRVAERVTEQAKEFGITEEESIEMGKKAAAFTRSVLSRPFKVTTRGQNALGASQLKREYAFIETADGEDLGEMLVSRGLARSFGEDASPPGKSASSVRSKYDRLEASARRQRIGVWGDGAAAPTMELTDKAEEEPEKKEEGGSYEEPDLMGSTLQNLGIQ